MKKFFTSLALTLLAIVCALPTSAATSVMGADKLTGTQTAYDLAGTYELEYYCMIIYNSTYTGELLNFSFIDIEPIDETIVKIKGFFHEDAEEIIAEFNPEDMTLTIPNGSYIGVITTNKGQTNEAKFNAYLKLMDHDANMFSNDGILSSDDIVIGVNPQKRRMFWEGNHSGKMFKSSIFIANEDNQFIDRIGYFRMMYTNCRTQYTLSNGNGEFKHVPHFAEYLPDVRILNLYNFNTDGWYENPVEFVVNDDYTSMTCENQQYITDAIATAFNYWISEVGQTNPFKLTMGIEPAEDGYNLVIPEWTYYSKQLTYFLTFQNNSGRLYGEIFGETAEKPVIYPTVEEYEAANGEISHATITVPEGTEVFYTIDGSAPSEKTGICYDSPIEINKNVNIRAIAIKEGKLPSFQASANYSVAGVKEVAAEPLNVYVAGNRIMAPAGARAFSLSGSEININDAVAAGMYIVTFNGKSAKVFVK